MFALKSLFVLLTTILLQVFQQPKTAHVFPKPTTVITPTSTSSENSILPTLTPQPTSPQPLSNSQFIYPNATVTSQSTNQTTLLSTDDPTSIVNWYKTDFLNNDMHSTAISTSQTNDAIDDELAGDNGSLQVKISIHKNVEESSSTITVSIAQSTSGSINIQNNTYNSSNTY